MRRALAAAVLALAPVLAWAAETPPRRDGPTCVALFEQYDRTARFGPQITFRRNSGAPILPGGLARQTGKLRRAGCLTLSADLDGMEALRARLGEFRIEQGGAAIRPVPVHLGVVTWIGDEMRATQFFRSLGYRSRGVGAPELGRRLYVGPFTSERALAQALELARAAGFIAPYPATQTRF